VRGSELSAGANATLKADGDVNLMASQDVNTLTGANSSKSGSVGISIGTSGFGVTVSGSAGKGKEAGNGTTYNNTRVTAGDTVAIQSGANTTLQGAVIKGDTVKADAGGNLSIASLQDTDTYNSKTQSAGGSVTIGAGAGASLNASKSKVDSTYASVTE
jgi:filamentous hemagglutinin